MKFQSSKQNGAANLGDEGIIEQKLSQTFDFGTFIHERNKKAMENCPPPSDIVLESAGIALLIQGLIQPKPFECGKAPATTFTFSNRFARRANPWRRTISFGSPMQLANRGIWASTSAVHCIHKSESATITLLRTWIGRQSVTSSAAPKKTPSLSVWL
jgi:hypothetical protein